MQVRTRKQTSATAPDSPFRTYEQLGARWGKSGKTIANGITSGKIPLKPFRPYPGADPVLSLLEIEQLEAQQLQAAE